MACTGEKLVELGLGAGQPPSECLLLDRLDDGGVVVVVHAEDRNPPVEQGTRPRAPS
ncbi:hypothetical protein [Streptomyces sp. NPDC058108]|uniref:hypothetical protein n=1 Tax=Streptomyces sp. NPDC058108 TaxID=3346344 RepID=UPI0036EE5DC4